MKNYFKQEELECHCGCHQCKIDDKLLELLNILRETVGRPVILTNAFRCKQHNIAVGGAPGSYHTKGMAADVKIAGMTPAEVAAIAEKIGFTGIGVYPTFTHLDVREGKARWRK